ncbi:MAG TPA: hypothetical protein VJ826_09720 [Candidatus Polarisedimenticolaceae bacterium]|nr:hypothetical protein [Candidatus Polarisedimenticolaceae bacterium]
MKAEPRRDTDTMREEYVFDYSTGVRGKYYDRAIAERSNLVALDPDVAKVFRSSAEVNQGLRILLEIVAAIRGVGARKKPTRRAAAARR